MYLFMGCPAGVCSTSYPWRRSTSMTVLLPRKWPATSKREVMSYLWKVSKKSDNFNTDTHLNSSIPNTQTWEWYQLFPQERKKRLFPKIFQATLSSWHLPIVYLFSSFISYLLSSFSIFLSLFSLFLNSNFLSFSLWPFQLGEVGALRLQVAMSRGLHSSPHSDKGEQGPIVWVSSAVAPKSCVNNEPWHFNLALSHWQREVGLYVLWVPWCCSIPRTNKC